MGSYTEVQNPDPKAEDTIQGYKSPGAYHGGVWLLNLTTCDYVGEGRSSAGAGGKLSSISGRRIFG